MTDFTFVPCYKYEILVCSNLLAFLGTPRWKLTFIGAQIWHVKRLVGQEVWIYRNESSCSQIWRVRPPATYLCGPPVVEISTRIKIPPWVQTPMKAPISCPRTKRAMYFIVEPGGVWIDAKDIGSQLAPISVVEGQIDPSLCDCMSITIFIQKSTLALVFLGQVSPLQWRRARIWLILLFLAE